MISLLSQVLIVTAIGMVAWVAWGYSMAFTDGGGLNKFVGGFSKVGLAGVDTATMVESFSVGVAIPEIVFVAFQTADQPLGDLTCFIGKRQIVDPEVEISICQSDRYGR